MLQHCQIQCVILALVDNRGIGHYGLDKDLFLVRISELQFEVGGK